MKKTILTTIGLLILLAICTATYLYFQQKEAPPQPQSVDIPEVASTLAIPKTAPNTRQVLNEPTEQMALPALSASDDFMASALESLLNNKALMAIFINDQLINNIVVTIDNLPRKQITMRFMPIKKAPGRFLIMESEGQKAIHPDNNTRYASYVNVAASVDAQQLVKLYIQLYPLFQQAYQDLGYPNQDFNDRLMTVLDDLLATPTIAEPIALIQPKHFYLYADPALENRSIGQRILMRIGNENGEIIKAKLAAIQQTLISNMHEQSLTDNKQH